MASSWMHTARSLTVSRGGVCPEGVSAQGCLPRGGQCLPGGRCLLLGGCAMWPIPSCIWCYLYAVPAQLRLKSNAAAYIVVAMWPGKACWDTSLPLWTEFLTQACDNITFPQLLLWAVMNAAVLLAWMMFDDGPKYLSTVQIGHDLHTFLVC